MSAAYDVRAAKRPVNLSLNEDLVRKLREVTGNLSEADTALRNAVAAWNDFGDHVGSFADEHSTL